MVKGDNNNTPVVVSMRYMIDIVSKTHESLNHVGRHKLVGAIKPFFWHPGLDGLCRDYCKSCPHCQRVKSHRIERTPPVRKISTTRPFELLCVDLLKYPKSRKGHEYMLVCIDHFSKWLSVQPIKDKRSITVADALKHKVLPSLPRIPERLLSDHGAEFTGREYQKVLQDMNILHCMSSPYFAPGNGCAERVNRTIIQLLKGDAGNCWDEKLYKMVINYNNSVHSEIKMTPSQCILAEKHDVQQRFPVSSEVIRNWREGNPKFCSFRVGQKVLKKVNRVGTLLVHKMQDRYEGPFVVSKVNSNGLSYEICKEGDKARQWKVNHRHLRPWYDIPHYIGRYLDNKREKDPDITSKLETSSKASLTGETDTSDSSESDSSSTSESSSSGSTNLPLERPRRMTAVYRSQ